MALCNSAMHKFVLVLLILSEKRYIRKVNSGVISTLIRCRKFQVFFFIYLLNDHLFGIEATLPI
jgi:hypothetical protein